MREKKLRQSWSLLILWLVLAQACAPMRPAELSSAPVESCMNYFQHLDKALQARNLRDEGDAAVEGFPYLRVNRFLASYAQEPLTDEQLNDWVTHLGELDQLARNAELKSLSEVTNEFSEPKLNKCRVLLLARDIANPERIKKLRNTAQVDDDYRTDWQVAGLYPISSLFVGSRINRWQRQVYDTFAVPLPDLNHRGKLQRWSSRKTAQTTITDQIRSTTLPGDSLGIPIISQPRLEALFAAHAPVWEVDVVDNNDIIGRPRKGKPPYVDINDPVEYRLLSYTKWQGKVLPQLNYVIWFNARPGNDIYAGALDGLIWRVTLDTDGEPIMYDSIHNCGCYHHFFPHPKLQPRQNISGRTESPLIPQKAPQESPIVIRLASGTHYIERVYSGPEIEAVSPLRAEGYDVLRGVRGGGSLFSRHGLVPGSERKERFLLWLTGVRSPGAMRQWGRHATAFVGRRHFDDPYLLETLFE